MALPAVALATEAACQNGLQMGPADSLTQFELIQALSDRESGPDCGVSAFYPWFQGMLFAFSKNGRSPTDQLKALSSLFSSEKAQKAFAAGAENMAEFVERDDKFEQYPTGVPGRPLCISGYLEPGQKLIEYSRPYRVGQIVFLERTVRGNASGGVDILALEKNDEGGWDVFDIALGPISD